MKRAVIVALLLMVPAVANGQMLHAVIYHAADGAGKAPNSVCKLQYVWNVGSYKSDAIWYAYISESESKCLADNGVKYWTGASAKDAWKAVYASPLADAKGVFENVIKVKAVVYDDKEQKNVEKVIPLSKAKSMGVDTSSFDLDATGNLALPRKIFDGGMK